MTRLRFLPARICLSATLLALTSLGLLTQACSEPSASAQPDASTVEFGGVVGTRPQVGPLVGGADGIPILTFDAPATLRAGEHFRIRIGAGRPPGGSSFGAAIVHIVDSPTASVMGTKAFPSPAGQGVGDLWSIDLRGQLSPKFDGEQRTYEVEVALIDENGQLGPVMRWTPTLIAQDPPACPVAAACGAAACGFESQCGLNCGPQQGACDPGLVCSTDQQCVPVGDACPLAKECTGLECGIDPVCGASCGECEAGEICSDALICVQDTSTSEDECPVGQVSCAGVCVDPQTDPRFCGASGRCEGADLGVVCAATETCSQGICVLACAGGDVKCGDSCIDPDNDPAHCGAGTDCSTSPGDVCETNEVCSLGKCGESCAAGVEVLCDGRCIEPETDTEHCGARADCVGSNAGQACGPQEVCSGGMCRPECAQGQLKCDGECVDPLQDSDYCGATGDCLAGNAGKVCETGDFCVLGSCTKECPAGLVGCGEQCVDPSKDLNHCGAALDCLGTNAGEICVGGERCQDGACLNPCTDSAQVQCGGTCINPATNADACGAKLDCRGANAGMDCGDEATCQSGMCKLACLPGELACGLHCADPKTDEAFCGAVGPDCTGGSVCAAQESCVEGGCHEIPATCTGTIVFPDAVLEAKIRAQIGKPTGSIVLRDTLAVKSLDLGKKEPESMGISNLSGLECFLNLESLKSAEMGYGDPAIDDVSALAGLKRLKELELSGQFGWSNFSSLAGLTELEVFRIHPNPGVGAPEAPAMHAIARAAEPNVEDRFAFVSGLTKLRVLDLGGFAIDDFTILTNLKNLEELAVWLSGKDAVALLSEFTRLRVLSLGGVSCDDLSPLSTLAQLEELDCGADTSLAALSAFKQLRRLSVSGQEVTDLSPIAGLTNLVKLSVTGTKISDASPIVGLDKLVELSLSSNQIVALTTSWSGLKSLTSAALVGNRIKNISGLAGAPVLATLDLSVNEVANLSALSGMKTLRSLNVYRNAVNDLSPLAGLTNLETFTAFSNAITTFDALYSLPKLHDVELSNNPLTCSDAQREFVSAFLAAGHKFSWSCR